MSSIEDQDAFDYCLLLFLVRAADLRLISIWHPSYLLRLLPKLEGYMQSIVTALRTGTLDDDLPIPQPLRHSLNDHFRKDLRRAAELEALNRDRPIDVGRIWPRLRLISCWTKRGYDADVELLRQRFPGVAVQGKGLLATEGVVTIPFGHRDAHVCAVTSHFLEFESGDGETVPVSELSNGDVYSAVLTTGGGLYRYRLHDRVEVTGQYHATPCLRFLGKDNVVSDLVGEKLELCHVGKVLETVSRSHGKGSTFEFAMVAPETDPCPGYVLFLKTTADDSTCKAAAERVETGLCENYHYRHARGRDQLAALRVFRIKGDPREAYFSRMVSRRMTLGDIKVLPLSLLQGWPKTFEGEFVSVDG